MDDVDNAPTSNIPPKINSKSAEKKDWLYKCAIEIFDSYVINGFEADSTEDDEQEGNS